MSAPRGPVAASAFVASVILAGTLTPVGGGGASPVWCATALVCGTHGTADVLLNVFLFVPLGASLRAWTGRTWRAAGAAVLLSAAIEAAQLSVPGRVTSLGDVVFNGLGAVLGATCWAALALRLAGPRGLPRWLGLSAVGGALGVVAATGMLSRPLPPAGPYLVQWTPRLEGLPRYHGRVLAASLSGIPLGIGPAPAGAEAAVARGVDLRVHGVAGPTPRGRAPLVRLVTADGGDVAQLAVSGNDLVLTVRRRGGTLGLDEPEVVFPGVMAGVVSGRDVEVHVWRRTPVEYCAQVDPAGARSCHGGSTVGRGWVLLLGASDLPPDVDALLDATYLVLLFGCAGILLTGAPAALASALLVAGGLTALPGWLELAPTPRHQLFSAVGGLGLGWLCARRAEEFREPIEAPVDPLESGVEGRPALHERVRDGAPGSGDGVEVTEDQHTPRRRPEVA